MGEFRETEFGQIPIDWDLSPINSLKANQKYSIAMGPFGSNIKAENFVNTGVPVIRGTNLNYYKYVGGEFVFLSEEKANELSSSNCKSGDLIFTHRGTIGQVGLVPEGKYKRYVVSQSGMKLTVDETKIKNEFLFYFFKSKYGQHQLFKSEAQVGVPSISNPLTTLKAIEVPVPPIPEQQSIASILSSLDDKIDLLHRQNKTLEALAETLFRQWFVEEADESWEEVKLKSLCEVITKGTTPTTLGKQFVSNGVHFLKVESLTEEGDFIESKFAFIDLETDKLLSRSRIQCDDVLITIAGTIGRVAIVTPRILPANTNQAIAIIRANKEIINPVFIYLLLKSPIVINDFESRVVHAVQPNLSLGEIGDISFRLPPKGLLKNYSIEINYLIDKKEKNNIQIRTLTQLRDTLLPKLMSGEVRVKQ